MHTHTWGPRIIRPDIVRLSYMWQGMIYLHKSKFRSHGHLTSAECHVDSRWVLKIGGFGLDAFRNEQRDARQVCL